MAAIEADCRISHLSERDTMVKKDVAIKRLLDDGLSDWITLHRVVWRVTRGSRTDEAKRLTLEVLRELFEQGWMVPGDLGESGFEDWTLPIGDWLVRAEQQLESLGWNPMGDGLWLRLTEAGDAIAEANRAGKNRRRE
ncbi:hypothetical protein [Arthrobacter sp. NPDC090010]|uniref:hypothetical protein n=1 Tax=Arthrobacter sp. NPDC090010 TaxID=3363942 RepID=UPI00382E68E6